METVVQTLVTVAVTFLATIFLPKQVGIFIRDLLKFILLSIVKYWYLLIVLSALLLSILILIKINPVFSIYPVTNPELIWILLVSLSLTTCYAIRQVLIIKADSPSIAIYECYSVRESEYLTIDVDSESLNSKIRQIKSQIEKDFYSYHKKLIIVELVTIPKFIVIFLGYSGLKEFIRKRVDSGKHIAALYFVRNINKQHVSVVLQHDTKNLTNTSPLTHAEKILNELSGDENVNGSYIIDFSVKIYMLLFGQSIIDLLFSLKTYQEIHTVLTDCEKQLREIKSYVPTFPVERRESIEHFIRFWSASTERYRAVVCLSQKEYKGAIKHIIKSTELLPYLPYDSYAALKEDLPKKHAIQWIKDRLRNPENNPNQTNSDADVARLTATKDRLLRQVNFPDVLFTYEVILDIVRADNSDRTVEELDRQLETLDESDPFVVLTKSEVIRYLKKGTERYNEIYAARFDETIRLLRKAITLDTDFPLLHAKLGSLLCVKSMHTTDEKLLEEGMREYDKGLHIMKELGLD